MADPTPLTSDELQVLTGEFTLPDVSQRGAWVLRDKLVRPMTIGAPVLSDLLWDNVHFESLVWPSGVLRGAQLQGCRFDDAELSNTLFEDVLFVRCDLRGLHASHATFRKCRFEECQLTSLVAFDSRFERCTLDDTTLHVVDFREVSLTDTSFAKCKLDYLRASESTWISCVLSDGHLKQSRFSYCNTQSLRLHGVRIDQLRVLGGQHADLQLRALQGNGLSLVSVQLRELSVTQCKSFAELRLITSHVHGVAIHDNPKLMGFMIFRGETSSLHIARSTLIGTAFEEARIGPASVYEETIFAGINVTASEWTRPQLVHCNFSEFLHLFRSTITGLVTSGVGYVTPLDEIVEDVTWQDTLERLGAGGVGP